MKGQSFQVFFISSYLIYSYWLIKSYHIAVTWVFHCFPQHTVTELLLLPCHFSFIWSWFGFQTCVFVSAVVFSHPFLSRWAARRVISTFVSNWWCSLFPFILVEYSLFFPICFLLNYTHDSLILLRDLSKWIEWPTSRFCIVC